MAPEDWDAEVAELRQGRGGFYGFGPGVSQGLSIASGVGVRPEQGTEGKRTCMSSAKVKGMARSLTPTPGESTIVL